MTDPTPAETVTRFGTWSGDSQPVEMSNGSYVLFSAYAAVTQELPDTFYADRTLNERVKFMVQGWQKAVESNKQVDALHARLQAVEGALKDCVVEMKKVIKSNRDEGNRGTVHHDYRAALDKAKAALHGPTT